ncbi:MAG: hypothetical protein FJ096_13275 [Deltaproteobacteria bacterium]|nr:hypothetical protein [Deltaproteobacteria bacterium]
MAPANSVPRVTERGAVPLPPNLTIKDADRLARSIRASWDEVFGSAPPPSTRGASEPPPARTNRVDFKSHASHANAALGAPPLPAPSFAGDDPDLRSRRNMPAAAISDDDDAIEAPVASSGLPVGKIALGVGALAVVGVLAFVFTRPADKKADTATTSAATAATVAPAPPPPPSAIPAPRPEATMTAPAPSAASTGEAKPEPKPEAAAEAPKPETDPKPATTPAVPKTPVTKTASPPPPPPPPPPKSKSNNTMSTDVPF